MPTTADNEGLKVSVSTWEKGKKVLPDWIKFDETSMEYEISPKSANKGKSFEVVVSLRDEFEAKNEYRFTIEVVTGFSKGASIFKQA